MSRDVSILSFPVAALAPERSAAGVGEGRAACREGARPQGTL